eukprot:7618848-Pyramimonas_sp.AAC.2
MTGLQPGWSYRVEFVAIDFQGPFGQQHALPFATPPARRRRLAQATPPATTNVLQVRGGPERSTKNIYIRIRSLTSK